MRWSVLVAVLALLASACQSRPDVELAPGPGRQAIAWEHLGQVETVLDAQVAAAVVEDEQALAEAWAAHGFDGEPVPVDFDEEVVLLLGQADDACPDELVRVEVVEARLEVDWLEPPGGCVLPLIMRLHAVRVHRGHLAERFEVSLPPPFETELQPVTIELPPYDGDAPPPPEPPVAMTSEALDEVFAGHPVRRCQDEDRLVGRNAVDGPLSDDPDVAEHQRRRAEFGLPSDEDAVLRAMASPDRDDEYGFPMLREERELDDEVSMLVSSVGELLRERGLDTDREVVPMLDRSDGISAAVVVWEQDADRIRTMLDAELGPDAVTVKTRPYSPAALDRAQLQVHEASLPQSGPGSITWSSGFPGPVQVGIIDPSRETLDAIAAAVDDPDLVCVDPVLSGVRPLGDGG